MKYSLPIYISKAFLVILDWDLVKKSQSILIYASFTAIVIYFMQIKYMYHPLANTELLVKLQWLYPSIFVLNAFLTHYRCRMLSIYNAGIYTTRFCLLNALCVLSSCRISHHS